MDKARKRLSSVPVSHRFTTVIDDLDNLKPQAETAAPSRRGRRCPASAVQVRSRGAKLWRRCCCRCAGTVRASGSGTRRLHSGDADPWRAYVYSACSSRVSFQNLEKKKKEFPSKAMNRALEKSVQCLLVDGVCTKTVMCRHASQIPPSSTPNAQLKNTYALTLNT